jgi:hypothetical protein
MWTVTIKIIKLLKLKRSKTKRLAFEQVVDDKC